MRCDRKELLGNYLSSEKLREISSLTEEELESMSFSKASSDLLVEATKKLIFHYCEDASEAVILRNINSIF